MTDTHSSIHSRHLTVGVAGHIDHGKTALVRALTGMETDRLKEEQARGMSIVLGFAHLAVRGGEIDLIDVPGHEKFVKTMIAGATGIDAALLVVAANERVKPQTVEHVALMELLGVRQGLVAVTKSDLVPGDEERAQAADDLRGFLGGTFLRDAPVVFVSALSGEGLPELRATLADLPGRPESGCSPAAFLLPLDRVFTLTGHGTVATGTLRRGPLTLGQTVDVWPRGGRAEVRGLEVHGQPVTTAGPGRRVAVNLRGVKKGDLTHGDTLASVGTLRPTRLLDARLTLLASAAKPLKRGQAVVLHTGTAETPARVYPLGPNEILPGGACFVQMRLSGDAVLTAGEPFVIRLPSPAETLGGGRIVDPYPAKHTHSDDALQQALGVLADGSPAGRFLQKLGEAGAAGRDERELLGDLGLSAADLPPDLPMVRCPGGLCLRRDVFQALGRQAQALVAQSHAAHPLRRGMPLEELRRRLPPDLKPAAFGLLLDAARAGTLETVDGLARTPGYDPEAALSPVELGIAREIEAQFRDGGLRPPDLDAVLKRDRRRKNLYFLLVESGILVPATERTSNRTVVFHRDTLTEAAARLHAALAGGAGQTVSELNAALGTTRKFSIPLLEYFDGLGITQRAGDLRFLAKGGDDTDG